MSATEVKIGILAPSPADRDVLRNQLSSLSFATIELEVDQYCRVLNDRNTSRFLDSRPDVVIVDMEDPDAALASLKVLHQSLPETWLFVTSSESDSALIIEAMRAGAREFLFKPIQPRSLAQALDRFLAERERERQRKQAGEIYCVTSSKGGSGATTVAINFASTLAQLPESRVALIDLNTPVGDAAAYLNLKPEYTVSDALTASSRLDSVLLESYMVGADGFDLLAAPKEFWPEQAPGVSMPQDNAIGRLLEIVSHTYTHTVVDVTSYLDKEWLKVVLEAASATVVVLTPELPALWRTKRLMSFLSACGDPQKMHLVLNRCRTSNDITEAEIARVLNREVFWKLPNNYNASIEAINTGSPIVVNNHSALAASYKDFCYRITGAEPPQKSKKLFGLFARSTGNGE